VAWAWRALPTSGVVGIAALVVEAAVVAAVWTAPLAAGIKAAVTACVSVIVAAAVGFCVVWAWSEAMVVRRVRGGVSVASESRSTVVSGTYEY
jgi:hypothetical protein